MRRTIELSARIESHIERVTESGCWLWTGSLDGSGYGVMNVGSRSDGSRRQVRAPRLAWQLHVGPVPRGMHVLHRCDVRACANPAHLFLGTNLDNIADRHGKGRTLAGEQHANAKLDAGKVRLIRASTEHAYRLAPQLGVSATTICRVRRGEAWRGVQ
jgi:Autographiviridae endonuclease